MISFGDNSFIRYTYSATGEKLGVQYGARLQPLLSPVGRDAEMSENGDAAGTMQDRSGDFDPGIPGTIAVDVISYCGNVVYDCGTTRLLTDEGYVTFAADGTSWSGTTTARSKKQRVDILRQQTLSQGSAIAVFLVFFALSGARKGIFAYFCHSRSLLLAMGMMFAANGERHCILIN